MKVVEFIRKYARKSDKSRFSHFCPICSTLTFSSSYFLPLIFFLFLLFSCSTTKKLTEDEVLYVRDSSESETQQYTKFSRFRSAVCETQ